MSPRQVDRENPDRLYTVTGGRRLGDDDPFDLVSLIVSRQDPTPGMQSEYVRILLICRDPTAVVEISSYLQMPVSVVKILLRDLLEAGSIKVRRPASVRAGTTGPDIPDHDTLKKVLVGLKKL